MTPSERASLYKLNRQKARTAPEIIKARDKLIDFVNNNPEHHSIFLMYKYIHKLNLRLAALEE